MNTFLSTTTKLAALAAMLLLAAPGAIAQPLQVTLEQVSSTSNQMVFKVSVSTNHPNMKLAALVPSVNWNGGGTIPASPAPTVGFVLGTTFGGLNGPAPGINTNIKRVWANQTNAGAGSAVQVTTTPTEFGTFTVTAGAGNNFTYPFSFVPNTTNTASPNASPQMSALVYNNNSGTVTPISVANGNITVTPNPFPVTLAMPVELVDVRAVAQGDGNVVSWTTATELNSQYHIVERSADSTGGWTEVGRRQAAGTSQTRRDYSLVDERPLAVSYYRLLLQDIDGRYEYSKVVSVERTSGGFGVVGLYPVPASDMVKVQVSVPEPSSLTLTLSDINGRLLRHTLMELEKGVSEVQVDLSGYAAGTYIVRLDNGITQLTEQIVKQ